MLNIFIGMTAAVMLLLGAAGILDTRSLQKGAEPSRFAACSPSSGQQAFRCFSAENPDVIGWLKIPGTNIDYPLVQGKDSYYLSHDAKGGEALSGSLFLTQQNRADFSDFNSVIYGHHMAGGLMFGDLDRFTEKDFFREHGTALLYFENQWHSLELLAVLHCDSRDGIWYTPDLPQEKRAEYLREIRENALFRRTANLSFEDHFIEMSTCTEGKTDSRLLLIGRIAHE